MSLIVVTGAFGSGKTLYSSLLGLRLAKSFKRKLITNYPLNLSSKLRSFYGVRTLRHIYHSNFEILPNSIQILDESSLGLNARDWSKLPSSIRVNLVQLRKIRTILIVIIQDYDQLDKSFRDLCHDWRWVRGWLSPPRDLESLPHLHFYSALHFNQFQFVRLQNDPQKRGNILYPWLAAKRREFFFPRSQDFDLFQSDFRIGAPSSISKFRYYQWQDF